MRGRLTAALGDVPTSEQVLRQASDVYRTIGATGHAERLARTRSISKATRRSGSCATGVPCSTLTLKTVRDVAGKRPNQGKTPFIHVVAGEKGKGSISS